MVNAPRESCLWQQQGKEKSSNSNCCVCTENWSVPSHLRTARTDEICLLIFKILIHYLCIIYIFYKNTVWFSFSVDNKYVLIFFNILPLNTGLHLSILPQFHVFQKNKTPKKFLMFIKQIRVWKDSKTLSQVSVVFELYLILSLFCVSCSSIKPSFLFLPLFPIS